MRSVPMNGHWQIMTGVLGSVLSASVLVAQQAPSPPTNLRILSNGAKQVARLELPDPRTTVKHSYFDYLASRPDVYRTFSLRDQEQVASYAQSQRRALSVTYDPLNDPDPRRQDAAKVVVPAESDSITNQVRLPIDVSDGTILITWDAWFGKEFRFANTGISNYKTFQFAAPEGKIWCEIRNRFSLAQEPAISLVDTRAYPVNRPFSDAFGPNVARELPLAPQASTFVVQPETWTRYWVLFEHTDQWDLYSLWMADESTDVVQLYDRVQLKYVRGVLSSFWLEYNTSSNQVIKNGPRPSGPLVGYVRNIVMLRNTADPTSLMQKPTR